MTAAKIPFDWDEETLPDPDEDYRALVRALRRHQGFGLFFIQCEPSSGEEIFTNLRSDLSHIHLVRLKLEDPIVSLSDEIEKQLPDLDQVDILFITGIEKSLLDYEESKRLAGWQSEEIYSYSWRGVPPILSNLNLQREQLRDRFRFCFVFSVRPFVIDYFIRRAPDFFDWRSGLFPFSSDPKEIHLAFESILSYSGNLIELSKMSEEVRQSELLRIKDLLKEGSLDQKQKADLCQAYGWLLVANEDYVGALGSWDQVLVYQPDDPLNWYIRGLILSFMDRYEEAIRSYDKALEYKPDQHEAWNNRGFALREIGQSQESMHKPTPDHGSES